jgi:hypothetical protein
MRRYLSCSFGLLGRLNAGVRGLRCTGFGVGLGFGAVDLGLDGVGFGFTVSFGRDGCSGFGVLGRDEGFTAFPVLLVDGSSPRGMRGKSFGRE